MHRMNLVACDKQRNLSERSYEKSAPPMSDIHISNEGDIKMMKGLNPSKALGPDELHLRVLKERGRTWSCICSFVPTIS